jgi:hypothetical protein
MQFKNIEDLKKEMVSNVDLQSQFKSDPVKAIQQIQQGNVPDNWVYRIVVGSLGLSVLLVIIGVIIIQLNNKGGDTTIPTVLTAISSGAIGALAGLLAPSPNSTSKNA